MPTGSSNESIPVILFGGALAGVTSDAIVHPIDTIRARLQVATTSTNNKGSSAGAGQQQPYKSATHAFSQIVRNEGVPALYRGFSIVAIGTIPGHALYFGGYELSKQFLNRIMFDPTQGEKIKDDSVIVHLTSGLVADVAGALTWTPMDVIKQRLQVQQKTGQAAKYKHSLHAMRVIIAEEGVRGLFRGFGTGIATYGPYVSLYFALYEQIKIYAASEKALNTKDVGNLPFYVYLFGSALAATFSAAVTCPLDVVKTRVQVQQKLPSGEYQYKNGFDAMRQIIKNEGTSALFQGVKPRCLWIAGGTAITMLAYEEIKKWIHTIQDST